MATFPYYDPIPRTAKYELQFPQATSPLDIACRAQVAAWLLQLEDSANFGAVSTYFNETVARDIQTEPVTGPFIRAYVVARNLVEYAERGADWDERVTFWLDVFGEISGLSPADNLYVNPLFEDTVGSGTWSGYTAAGVTTPNIDGHVWFQESSDVDVSSGQMECNTTAEVGVRRVLRYMASDNHTLEVGATYLIAYDVETVVRGTGNATILFSEGSNTGITVLNQVTAAGTQGQTRTNFVEFRVDDASAVAVFRAGIGATANTADHHVIFRNPRFIKVEDAPFRKLLTDDGAILTTADEEILQHDLATEDDMLYTDYMPERSNSVDAITVTSVYPAFDPVVDLTTDALPAGKYHITVSFVWEMASTNDAMIYRYTGDLASPEFHQASNDNDDVEPKAYTFPYEHSGGVFNMGMEASIDQNGQSPDIDILAANISIKRVS